MATVTMELRELIESGFKLFDFEYTFDDEDFKKEIEQHVIDHYYYYEIAFPPLKFKHKFRTRWLSMIGYYNDLHRTTKYHYNPLINRRFYEERSKKFDENTKANTRTNEDTQEEVSDYPQASFGSGDYKSGASQAERKGTQDSQADTTQTEKQENWYEGMEGTTYQDLIRKERENLLRLKTAIVEELKPLFILVY